MNGAERRRGEFYNPSVTRTPAQSRAELESPRARVPYIAGWEFPTTTDVRVNAHDTYSNCFRAAYGHYRPSVLA